LIDRLIAKGETPIYASSLEIDTFIKKLRVANLFETQFDVLVITKGKGAYKTKENIIKDSSHALAVPNGGTLTFTPDAGYLSDGTNSYLRTQYNPSTGGNLFQKDDACFVLWISGNLGAAPGNFMHGCADAGVNGVIIAGGAALNNRLNSVIAEVGTPRPYVNGFNCVTRSLSTGFSIIQNATKYDITAVSTLVPNIEAYILRLNFSTPFYAKNTETVHGYAYGKSISQANFNILQDIIYEYITQMGGVWLSRNRIVYNDTFKKTWIGVVCAYTQYILTLDNITGAITYNKIAAFNVSDDHNQPTILIRSSDNRFFTCYSEANTGTVIRYRISTNVLDASAWGTESTITPHNPNTPRFPSCFEVTNGDIYIFYSDYNIGTDTIVQAYIKSTDGGVNFGAQTIYNNKRYNIITQDLSNKNILHFISSDNPHKLTDPNKVCHFYFNAGTGTWHKSDGTDITASIPFDDSEVTTIKSYIHPEQSWIEDLILDSNGYPRILYEYYPNWTATPHLKKLYYSEWTGSAWTTPYEIHESVNRDISGVIGLEYPPVASFDRGNPNRIFASKDVGGVCEIFEITRISSSNFTSVQKTTGSTYDQWRPMTSNASIRNVFWFNKEIYTTYTNFKNQLMIGTF
jgi:hypothetical protein